MASTITAAQQALHDQQKADNDLVLSFRSVRRAVGLLGFFLPVALFLYSLIHQQPPLPTMSDYHYSPVGVIFTGTLCAIAVFLWSYQGFRRLKDQFFSDLVVARVASLGALGTAWIPALPRFDLPLCDLAALPANCNFVQQLLTPGLAGWAHVLSAAVFFAALVVFCLILFTRSPDDTAERRASKLIYRICGVIIILAMLAIAVLWGRPVAPGSLWQPVFWAEAVACFAFATSWAVKGDGMRWLVRLAVRITG
ncbi:MAG: hypothetical protein Q4G22_09475 [Paracoccus sp. (in: a-proteobacteria)]|uniref:hypothetical protein n=1 Tax=Paracoccus sp. TaxID=267 RepID=UPI0026E0D503|nr:hypothetical protein [Paracoccus sp. (in: a-proteobacteria)]MDO5632057.1 hypothetical protein [Paracoccus sp. (in: a-proteobacteria)]